MRSNTEWKIFMALQQGEVQGYDFDRMVVEFTMLNQGKVIACAISSAAMDNLEDGLSVKPEERVGQFMRLREIIEERASRKFLNEYVSGKYAVGPLPPQDKPNRPTFCRDLSGPGNHRPRSVVSRFKFSEP
jgi:hypothetical protein